MLDPQKLAGTLREQYETRGYAILQGVFPPEVAQAVLYYFQSDLGNTPASFKREYERGPFTERKAYELYSYDYPPAMTLHWGLTPFMHLATGKDLLPTHAYFRVYGKGDVCKIHTDRISCEYSLSLTLAYSDGKPWDLWIGLDYLGEVKEDDPPLATRITDPSRLRFAQASTQPGDAVLYRGVNHLHGRDTPNPNQWSAHLFLHWIDRNGPYRHKAFDGHEAECVRESRWVFPEQDTDVDIASRVEQR